VRRARGIRPVHVRRRIVIHFLLLRLSLLGQSGGRGGKTRLDMETLVSRGQIKWVLTLTRGLAICALRNAVIGESMGTAAASSSRTRGRLRLPSFLECPTQLSNKQEPLSKD
jgi:hypothetical protein